MLTAGCNQWNEGLDAVVEGEAVRITDDEMLKRLAQVWTTRWDGPWQFQARDGAYRDEGQEDEALVFAVRLTKVFAHAEGDPFGHTRHQF